MSSTIPAEAFVGMLIVAPFVIATLKLGVLKTPMLIVIMVNLFVGVVLRAIALANGLGTIEAPHLDEWEAVRLGLLVIGIASVLAFLGYVIGRWQRKSNAVERRDEIARRRWDETLSLAKCSVLAGMCALAAVSAYWFSTAARGLPYLDPVYVFFEVSRFRTYDIGGMEGNDAFLGVVTFFGNQIGAVLIWKAVAGSDRRNVEYASYAVLVSVVTLSAAVPGLLAGSRFGVFATVATFMVGWAVVRGRVGWKYVVGAAVSLLVVIAVIALQGRIRMEGDQIKVEQALQIRDAMWNVLDWVGTSGHFLAVDRVGYIADYVMRGENTFPTGGSLVAALLAFIPRRVWPEKPTIHEGVFVAEVVYGHFTGAGYPPGLIGGLLLNFGVLGLLLMPLFGYAAARVDGLAERARVDLSAFLRWTALWWSVGVDILQSSLATGVVVVVVKMGTAALVWRAIGGRGPLWLVKGRQNVIANDQTRERYSMTKARSKGAIRLHGQAAEESRWLRRRRHMRGLELRG